MHYRRIEFYFRTKIFQSRADLGRNNISRIFLSRVAERPVRGSRKSVGRNIADARRAARRRAKGVKLSDPSVYVHNPRLACARAVATDVTRPRRAMCFRCIRVKAIIGLRLHARRGCHFTTLRCFCFPSFQIFFYLFFFVRSRTRALAADVAISSNCERRADNSISTTINANE